MAYEEVFRRLELTWWDPEGVRVGDERAPLFAKQLEATMGTLQNFIVSEEGKQLLLEKGRRVLDIACGQGRYSREFEKLGLRTVAFDISAKMINQARKEGVASDYFIADALKIPLPSDSFPVVTAMEVSMHVSDFEQFVEELGRLTQPGGVAIFNFSNCRSMYTLWDKINPARKGMRSYPVHQYSRRETMAAVESAGLELREILPVGTIYPISLGERWQGTLINGDAALKLSEFFDRIPVIADELAHNLILMCQKPKA